MKKIITAEYLMTAGRSISPCEKEVRLFVKLFGNKGVRATKANIIRASKAGLNLGWLINCWLPREAAAKYRADLKTFDDKYWADRGAAYAKQADLKTADDKYRENRETAYAKYQADLKKIEIEIVYQYLNA